MQELIDQLAEKAGLTADQATKAIQTIKDYVKEKFPMLEGAVENLFGSNTNQPGATGDSSFVNDTTAKAGEVIDGLKDKLSGLFADKQ
jgi:hypothetical protein